MRYLLLFAGDRDEYDAMTREDSHAMMHRVGEWWARHAGEGRIVGGEQLEPPRTAKTVRHRGAEREVSDGPFIEAKEQVGGYAVIEVASLDDALELAKSWPPGGAVEVRPIIPMERMG